ncbi:MAG: SurA N-terminal domain-containing protein [Candidatus Omnitrophica bacterium]|nr:SurA N-terminal domain-containing protein [Candidatus Omnitrophota bacterium]
MKRYWIFLFVLLFIFGCSSQAKKAVIAEINNYKVTKEEFEEEFKESAFGREDTLESKKEFLNSLINRKLILQDAQKKGLDKDKNFLKMIERFWEHSLLKVALDKKTLESAGKGVLVTDKMIEEEYNRLLQEGKIDKTYEQMYSQIKWELIKRKESQLLNDWILSLHKNAKIKINYDLLKSNKGGKHE